MAIKLLFKIASRNRPLLLFKSLDNLIKNLSNNDDYLIIISLDSDDSSMCNREVITKLNIYSKLHNINFFISPSESKVSSLNRDIDKANIDWDTVINFTEYIDFCVMGFDNIIRNMESTPYALGKLKSKVIAIKSINNDGKDHKKIYMVGRNVYNSRGYLYNPKFKSVLYKGELEKLSAKEFNNEPLNPVFNYRHSDWFYYKADDTTKNKMNTWKEDLKTLETINNEN